MANCINFMIIGVSWVWELYSYIYRNVLSASSEIHIYVAKCERRIVSVWLLM